jgi:hypothetical protein
MGSDPGIFFLLHVLSSLFALHTDTEREETNHLYAYCIGLSQIRMKICGKITLNEHFEWSPNTLLTMAKEIDKICPEEGPIEIHGQGNNP